MTTTLASFHLINSNLQRTLTTTASKPMVARETEYYLANIGNIKSVDDFLANDRVFKYAMKAWGLEEMDYAKAFMRKVLESDLNDSSSFANKLTDKRYLEFAKAFNFLPTGDVELGALRAQDSGSEDAMIGLYTQQRISKGETAAAEADYFSKNIGSITSVDDLLADERLFNFALTSQGLDAKLASVSAIRNVLTSDLNDPDSVANTYGEKYQKLAAAFSFAADGSIAPGSSAQTEQQTKQMMLAYYDATDSDQSPAAAAFKIDYFKQTMANVSNVDDLVNNGFLRDFVATAAGLDPLYTTAATIRDILVSDLNDPDSVANQNALHKAVAATFNFNADGSLDSGATAQDTDQADALSELFTQHHDGDAVSKEQASTDYYRTAMKSVQHVDVLLSDSKLYNFILSAFDIDPEEVSKTKIKRVLLSDPANLTSYANLLQDQRFSDLAAAFNFDTDGFALGARQVQTADGAKNTIALYKATSDGSETAKNLADTEALYYDRTILTLSSVDQLLKNDRLKNFIVKAYGLQDATNDTLRKIFTSDLLDERSFVNTSGNEAYKALAADFKFDTDGSIQRAELGVAQSKPDVMRTRALYYRQAVEEDAGNENEGVRLALYFDRKAPTITSPYSILADKALLQVVQTALRLPTQMSLLDIDRQADMISKVLDVNDFKDPSKVQAFLTRFTAAWEMDNSTASQSSASILIGQPLEASISTSLLTNIQNLRLGGA